MENDLTAVVAGYVGIRVAVLIGFGFLFYNVLRPVRLAARKAKRNPAG